MYLTSDKLFQTDGNDLIESTFPIWNVILCLQNLFVVLSSLCVTHFPRQDEREMLEFLILKTGEAHLVW